jgi:hypothetical protein
LPEQLGGFMTISHGEPQANLKTQKNPQPLRLDISNVNLHITPEQFDRLCIDNPDLKLELTEDGQLMPLSPAAIEENEDIIHTLDRNGEPFTNEDIIHTLNRNGEPFTYDLKDLYWNPQAYEYLKEQAEIFDRCLPTLVEKYAGKYIVFENGQAIDFEDDEDVLLSRIANNESYLDRPAIFCKFIPTSLAATSANA